MGRYLFCKTYSDLDNYFPAKNTVQAYTVYIWFWPTLPNTSRTTPPHFITTTRTCMCSCSACMVSSYYYVCSALCCAPIPLPHAGTPISQTAPPRSLTTTTTATPTTASPPPQMSRMAPPPSHNQQSSQQQQLHVSLCKRVCVRMCVRVCVCVYLLPHTVNKAHSSGSCT